MFEEHAEAVVAYILSFLLTIIACLLLWDGYFLLIHFQYGRIEQTKLNRRPFTVMTVGLALSAIEVILIMAFQEPLNNYVRNFDFANFAQCTFYKEFFWWDNLIWINRVLKIFYLDFFVLTVGYELFTLLRFVVVQSGLQLEELDVRKPQFNRKENQIERMAKIGTRLLLALLILLLTAFMVTRFIVFFHIDLCISPKLSWSFQLMSITSLCVIVLILVFMIVFFIYFNCKMNRIHRLEFKKHFKKYTLLSVLLIISLLLEFVVVYMTFLLGRDQERYITFFFKNLWQILIPATLVEILPYLIFLTVSQLFLPHDCFRCFGKDPERKFSIYQFTKEELKMIERNKRGKGAL